jgi:hypothetical protein
VLKDPLQ